MAKVDYKNLDYDVLLGRKYRVCGRCKEEMAVTTECPKRVNSENKYVCWHCCWRCTYSVKTAGGRACSIKLKRRQAEKEQLRKEKAEKKLRKLKRDVGDAVPYAENVSFEE